MKYSLVAVSGGSDSMALLHRLINMNKNLVVCHVNYGVRESANRDEEIVRKFCVNNGVKLEVLKDIKYDKQDGNFENYARIVRYNFFKQIYDKYDCDYLYVGHNKDDLLETYFIQKKRNGKCDFYGLKEDICMYGMNVKRILLDYDKKELEEYCKYKGVEYGVDETNFDCSYLRNEFRHNVISKMSDEEKDTIIDEIKRLNVRKVKESNRIHEILEKICVSKNKIDLLKFRIVEEKDKIEVLYYFVIENVKVKIDISDSRIRDILSKINSSKPNIFLGKFSEFVLYKEYGFLTIKKEEEEFSYLIEGLDSYLGDFYISDTGRKLEKICVSKECFPLRLESYRGDDKRINRLFIDKKIPVSERKRWPVVKDKLGRVLLVLNIEKFYNIKDSSLDDVEFYIKRKSKENVNE